MTNIVKSNILESVEVSNLDELVKNTHQSRQINLVDNYPYWHYKDSELNTISDEIVTWQRSILQEIYDYLENKVVKLKSGQSALIFEKQEYRVNFDFNKIKIHSLCIWGDDWKENFNCNAIVVRTNSFDREYGQAKISNGRMGATGIQLLCKVLTELKPGKLASLNQIYSMFVDRLNVEALIENHWVKE